MNLHRRAKTCPGGRALLARRVLGETWSMDRSSRPHRSPRRLAADREQLPVELRGKHRLTAQVPAQLSHLEIEKLGRVQGADHCSHGYRKTRQQGIGWEFSHVSIDDSSRLFCLEVLSDERGASEAGFLRRALAWYRQRGSHARRILTNNGSGYISKIFAQMCTKDRLRQLRTGLYA